VAEPHEHKGKLGAYVKDRAAWRKWLEKIGQTSKGVWLVYYKRQSGKPRVSYDESVEEAALRVDRSGGQLI